MISYVNRISAEFRNQGTIFGGIGPISDRSPPIRTPEFRTSVRFRTPFWRREN